MTELINNVNNSCAGKNAGRRGFQYKIARIVTEVFTPPLLAVVAMGVVSYQSSAHTSEFLKWWGLSSLLIGIIPVAFILMRLRGGHLSDHNMSVANQRYMPFVISIASNLAAFVVMRLMSAPPFIIAFTLSAVTVLVLAILLTPKCKMSIHCSTVAGMAIILTFVLGTWAWSMVILVPVVGWSRVKVAQHTVPQVVLGGMVGAGVTWAIFTLTSGM